ncbi:hypothetical protein KOI35_15320 [Actinoplanes bogorensis]|uniref:Uncharacterized protein n=1 Tax=Paractinoplanes bogorensis TaxID=1610840 RepID=A0ABS5YN32_9ACTN|nr:hypothetical protein [Actinoplanes bogorensis]MBU2664872.1 hypothetical protein [Actinoplanes bogorensis]
MIKIDWGGMVRIAPPRPGRALIAAVALIPLAVMAPSPAQAAGKLSVSKTKGLSRSGETVTVRGRGYNVDKGIYVAFCVDNGAGVLPSPCGGGADMSGASGSSAWISSNPPSYGEGLAQPYGSGGSFRVSIRVTQKIGDVDCVVRACAIVTRADHTRTSDRSQDVRVAVRFATPAGGAPAPAATRVPAVGTPRSNPSSRTPVGPPTGRLATAAPPSDAAPIDVQAVAAPSLDRTSTATPLGHWWAIGGAFLAGYLGAVVIGRLRRARANRRPS